MIRLEGRKKELEATEPGAGRICPARASDTGKREPVGDTEPKAQREVLKHTDSSFPACCSLLLMPLFDQMTCKSQNPFINGNSQGE